jgi:hypothetical protein
MDYNKELAINKLIATKIMRWVYIDELYHEGWYPEGTTVYNALVKDLQETSSFAPMGRYHDAIKVASMITKNTALRLHLVCAGVDDDDVDKGFAQAAFAEIMPLDDAWVECRGWHAIERSICLAALRYRGIAVLAV